MKKTIDPINFNMLRLQNEGLHAVKFDCVALTQDLMTLTSTYWYHIYTRDAVSTS